MNYRPTEFTVENGDSGTTTICLDHDADPGMPISFLISQDEDTVYVTLDALRGLVLAAEALLKGREA